MSAANGDAGRRREWVRAEEMFYRHVDKARAVAKRWAFKTMRGDEMEDLIQEGLVGLWKSCLTYDPGRGVKEWTWAHSHVTGAVTHYLRDKAWIVRLPKWIPPDERWAAASKFIVGIGQDPWTGRLRQLGADGEESPDENGPAEIDPGIERAEVLASLPALDARERLLVSMALGGERHADLAAADGGALARLMGKLADTKARREEAAQAAENAREMMRKRLQRRSGRKAGAAEAAR